MSNNKLTLIKRNDSITNFNKTKIKQAIVKAMKYGSGIYKPDIARLIAEDAYCYFERKEYENNSIPITQVEDYVYRRLIHYGQDLTAKAYEEYRVLRTQAREVRNTDEGILDLARGYNEEVSKENSNKNAKLASTQRDLIAGEVSKDIARRKLIPTRIVQAHDNGFIHYHK